MLDGSAISYCPGGRRRLCGSFLLEPDRGGTSMGVETFERAECFDDRQRALERASVETKDAGPPLKHIGGQAGERFASATSGQSMARARDEIARGDCRKTAEKNCSCGGDLFCELLFILRDHRKVLGRKLIHDLDP